MSSKESSPSKATPTTAIILAAGKGTRMLSPLPKVLHPVVGQPMIHWPVVACQAAGVSDIRVIVGHGKELVRGIVEPMGARAYEQLQQRGTADAVAAAKVDELNGIVVILNGDHPLIRAEDIRNIAEDFQERKLDLAVVSATVKHPGKAGRVVQRGNEFVAIVEAKDASADTLKIREVNSGLYMVRAEVLQEILPQVGSANKSNEFYLTDIAALSKEAGYQVGVIRVSPRIAFGVNTQGELAQATKFLFRKRAKYWMEKGCIIIDPDTTYIEPSVQIEGGVVLYPNVYLKGVTRIATCAVIESNCVLTDALVHSNVTIKASSVLDSCSVGAGATIGPFARLRPKAEIGEDAHIGNFVEIKNAKIGKRSKANHHTYLGDAEIGEDTNIGCGTITCNYAADRKKYKTVIGDRVFVGSDSQFVAPVTVGNDAVIGSGSTITKDVPARALGVARGKQFVKENYVAADVAENTPAGAKKSGE